MLVAAAVVCVSEGRLDMKSKLGAVLTAAGCALSADMGKPWARADLFFLEDSLKRGMSLGKIAGFLGRTGEEVQEKVKDLNR